ncbi:MAG TPA: Gfo/Idh/MocA family oxidoreductase [Planctomycetota bacterium]|jgi:predicted dehydrogenase
MAVLKVAIVGCGIGQSHLTAYKALPEHFEVRALCDLDKTKAGTIALENKIPHVLNDLSELCGLGDIDVIDLCTPPGLHFRQCLEVLAAGKHAICEKPLVGSLREIDELSAAEKRFGKCLMPIMQNRLGRGFQKLKFLIGEGLAGKTFLSTVETCWIRGADYFAAPWRGKWATELGGCLLGHGIHAHDALLHVLGPAKSVFARTATRVNPIETEDCASVSMEMADGSLASLSVTLGSCEEITRHRYCFENLVAESNHKPYASGTDPWKFVGRTPELQKKIDAALASFQPQPDGFVGQFKMFHEALAKGAALPVNLADARRALELVTAQYYSVRIKGPVELPLSVSNPFYSGWTR